MNARARQTGSVLIAVLVVVMLLSTVALSLMFRLQAEQAAAVAGTSYQQAWNAAMSGVYEAMRVIHESQPGALTWQDDPATFRDRFVCTDGSDRWYFTVFTSAGLTDRDEIRYGLTDEACKLNLNEATEDMLAKLPQMTPSLAQTLLDFIDADDTPRPEGAEQEYYDTLPRPYTIRNGPLDSVEELLLVRGFTAGLVYGEDANLNYQLDPNEDDADILFPLDNKDGRLERGFHQYLTTSSYDSNLNQTNAPRINVNDAAAALPEAAWPETVQQYLSAMRSNQVTVAHVAELLEAKGKFKDAQGTEVEMESGVGKNELPIVLDLLTTTEDKRFNGLLNVNTAPAQVLQCLPDLDEALAESIVSTRSSLGPERRETLAWLFAEGVVSAELFKKIAPYLTARSRQFNFHVVGFGVPSGRYRVLDVIIDAGSGEPVIQYLRDITRLGLPFKIETTVETPAG